MRIALVSDTYTPQVNGVTTVLQRMIRALGAAGHDVTIVAPAYPGGSARNTSELRIRSVPFPPYPAIRLSSPRFQPVRRFLDDFGPDLVHVATEGPLGFVGRRYALGRDIPLVTSLHTDFPAYARSYGAPGLGPLVWRWLSWFHGPAQLTHTPSQRLRDELRRRGVVHAEAWGCSVDVEWFHPSRRDAGWRRWLAGADDTVIVAHVGRLAAEKNLGTLIKAWRQVRARVGRRASFVIAGEGPYLRRLVTRLPWVRQLGFLEPADLATLYASCDICVLPSRTETCGLVALEAMASGLAVVAAAAGGFSENIVSGGTGVLVPPAHPTGFAEAIERLVLDSEERHRLGIAARGAAVGRDARKEDRILMDQYAAVARQGTLAPRWSAAS